MASGACTVHTQTQTHSPYAIYSEQGSHSLLIWKFLSLCKIRHSTLSCCCYSYIITARRFIFARNLISNQITWITPTERSVLKNWKHLLFGVNLAWFKVLLLNTIKLNLNASWSYILHMKLSWFYSTQSKWSNLCAWQKFPRIKENNDALKLQWTCNVLDECNYGFIKICHLIGQHNRDATACLQVIN